MKGWLYTGQQLRSHCEKFITERNPVTYSFVFSSKGSFGAPKWAGRLSTRSSQFFCEKKAACTKKDACGKVTLVYYKMIDSNETSSL